MLIEDRNGGPVILFQPENEYSQATSNIPFPDADFFQATEDMYRAAGIVVPFCKWFLSLDSITAIAASAVNPL